MATYYRLECIATNQTTSIPSGIRRTPVEALCNTAYGVDPLPRKSKHWVGTTPAQTSA